MSINLSVLTQNRTIIAAYSFVVVFMLLVILMIKMFNVNYCNLIYAIAI